MRLCLVCKKDGNVEVEFHVMFYCQVHKDSRAILFDHANDIEHNFTNFSDAQKLEFLTTHQNIMRKTAHFIHNMLLIRQRLLSIN